MNSNYAFIFIIIFVEKKHIAFEPLRIVVKSKNLGLLKEIDSLIEESKFIYKAILKIQTQLDRFLFYLNKEGSKSWTVKVIGENYSLRYYYLNKSVFGLEAAEFSSSFFIKSTANTGLMI